MFHHEKKAKLKHAKNANTKISDKKHVNSPIGLLQYIRTKPFCVKGMSFAEFLTKRDELFQFLSKIAHANWALVS
jgi:hypothetical protein